MKKTNLAVGIALFLILMSLMQAGAQISYCCEKTKVLENGKGGAWCQNAPEEQCDENYRKAPTLCESTSYCKKGCCFNSNTGECSENTPQRICEENNGIWEDEPSCNIAPCELGCCVLGNSAAFVSQTRCKKLSEVYGLTTNFRSDIKSEVECILSVTSEVEGACVLKKEFETTCIRTSKKECIERKDRGEDAEFYEGKLCSAPELHTNCGPSKKTTCVEKDDKVYFLDTCGNTANIYDSQRQNDLEYWRVIKSPEESCGFNDANANSKTCGNCDYYLGSTCKKYEKGKGMNKPEYGDYICKDLSCTWHGEKYRHGEKWCAHAEGTGKILSKEGKKTTEKEKPLEENLPGSRYYQLKCYNGEVTIEPCADYRQEVCVQSEINGFKTSQCLTNRWHDCTSQKNKKDCENQDVRDCTWKKISFPETSVCVPKFPPGFNFESSDREDLCSLADVTCTVEYERKLETDAKNLGGIMSVVSEIFNAGGDSIKTEWEAKKGKQCDPMNKDRFNKWINEMNEFCASLGDCGATVNYMSKEGDLKVKELVTYTKIKEPKK